MVRAIYLVILKLAAKGEVSMVTSATQEVASDKRSENIRIILTQEENVLVGPKKLMLKSM